ncbi:MAG: carbohydrate kinase family protein [Endomicrobia bacterium]|nr:carbohydrate kinase family protein [Endomicrobiia bacterium]
MKYDCCCIGRSCIDYIAVVKNYPQKDTKTPLLQYQICLGGQAANSSLVLANLGVKTLLVTSLGQDKLGDMAKKWLRNVKNLKTIYIALKNLKTPSAFIWAEKKSGKRTIVYEKIYQNITYPADIIEKSIKNSSFVLFDHQSCKDIYEISYLFSKYKIKLMMDAERKDNYMFKMLPHINFFVCSKELAKSLKMPVKKLLKKFINMGPEIVCCTLGEKGAVAIVKGENKIYYEKSYKVSPVDTTGAGDVFHAGFLYGIIKKWKIKEILKFSNRLASLSVKYIGGNNFLNSSEFKVLL